MIGSIRRECLDHVIVWGESHLRRILRSYARYYAFDMIVARYLKFTGLVHPSNDAEAGRPAPVEAMTLESGGALRLRYRLQNR